MMEAYFQRVIGRYRGYLQSYKHMLTQAEKALMADEIRCFEGYLAELKHLRKHQAEQSTPASMYTFNYDLEGGKRGAQDIMASSLEDAFKRFGWVMNEFKLHPFNIRYEHQAEPSTLASSPEEG